MAEVGPGQPPFYVEYLTGKTGVPGALNTRKDIRRLTRDELASSINMWVTPLGALSTRPPIANFGGGSISGTGTTGTTGYTVTPPFQGAAVIRFAGVSYVMVQDNTGGIFAFPKYAGNTSQWFFCWTMGSPVLFTLTPNIAQLFDPSLGANPQGGTGQNAAFFPSTTAGFGGPALYTGTATFCNTNTTAGVGTVFTPSGGMGMTGFYVGQSLRIGQNTAHFETVTVSAVSATTFTATTAQNHSIGEVISGGALAPGTTPKNFQNAANITPRFTETLFSNLIYSGEPTAPTAVYVSDPYAPESFTSNFFQSTIYPGTYQPALIGHNDGIGGGDVTGTRRLANQCMVYKQSAIYRLYLTGMYNDMIWADAIVSPSVGCVAPDSIVSFDTFHVFLSIDGVYSTDGNIVQRVDYNLPTFFDASGSALGATKITNYKNAIGTRFGSTYVLVFDKGDGYPNDGLWLDFEQVDSQGYPLGGELQFLGSVGGIGGLAAMRGPADTGTFFACSSQNNLTGEFAQSGFAAATDFTFATAHSFALKADGLDDIIPVGLFSKKTAIERIAVVGRETQNSGVAVLLSVTVTGAGVAGSLSLPTNNDVSQLSTPIVAPTLIIENPSGTSAFAPQIAINDGNTNTHPFTILGVLAEVTVQKPILS